MFKPDLLIDMELNNMLNLKLTDFIKLIDGNFLIFHGFRFRVNKYTTILFYPPPQN